MHRNTRQRASIRAIFEAAERPLSPGEVLAAAQATVAGTGLATIYRAIREYTERGWLAKVEIPGEPARYERAGKRHHHHFHCQSCGGVFDLPGCPKNLSKLAPRGFRVSGHEVLLYGQCLDCGRR
jgi:Fur family transcriptional regulator, ferric uptake regulator